MPRDRPSRAEAQGPGTWSASVPDRPAWGITALGLGTDTAGLPLQYGRGVDGTAVAAAHLISRWTGCNGTRAADIVEQ
jgi:hypothetical protein